MALDYSSIPTNQEKREMTPHGAPLFPVACYYVDLPTVSVPWHWHDELEVLVVSDGTAVFAAEGKHYTIYEGDGCFFNAGVLHSVWSADKSPCHLLSVVFHPRLVGGNMESVYWQNYLRPLLADKSQNFVHLELRVPWQKQVLGAVRRTWTGCVAETEGYEFDARSELSKVVFRLVQHRSSPEESALPASGRNSRDAERTKRMLQFIQEHYDRELTSEQIARSAGIGETECLRCFRSVIGTTPIQYLRQFRVERAADLLRATNLRISEIATQCGFQEMSYFSKTFRALKGVSPGAFRKRADVSGSCQRKDSA